MNITLKPLLMNEKKGLLKGLVADLKQDVPNRPNLRLNLIRFTERGEWARLTGDLNPIACVNLERIIHLDLLQN
jgi:hypothetical protein